MTTRVQTASPPSTSLRVRVLALYQRGERLLDHAQPLAALLARGYLAQVFFLSGLTKLRDWSVTLALFQHEYQVPLLLPEVASVLGTGGELALPVLLLLGLGGRFAALGLSVVNAVTVASLAEIAPAALQQHITWGVLLVTLSLYGCGAWALDSRLLRPGSAGPARPLDGNNAKT